VFKKLYLTYNSNVLEDGYFSQLQRQMAIYAITKKYGLSYYYTPISNVVITPLDPYQTKTEEENYISRYNEIYNFAEGSKKIKFTRTVEIHTPTFYSIFKEGLRSIFYPGKVLIKIVIPYRIIEKAPENYSYAVDHILPSFKPIKNKSTIVMHIRKGCLESHVTPGENSPRALSTQYFISVLNYMLESKIQLQSASLTIVTDAPENDFYYKPISEQKYLWEQFNYLENINGIKLSGHSFNEIKEYFPGEVNIIRGGDAQVAVSIMRVADYLIMSRSSMSYIGALLNNTGTIYYPPDFWHKPLKKWIKVSSFIDSNFKK
jgi:hypothetical protein